MVRTQQSRLTMGGLHCMWHHLVEVWRLLVSLSSMVQMRQRRPTMDGPHYMRHCLLGMLKSHASFLSTPQIRQQLDQRVGGATTISITFLSFVFLLKSTYGFCKPN